MKKNNTVVLDTSKIEDIDVLRKKKLHNQILLSRWKRKMVSAHKKVQKYRTFKKQFNHQIASMSR